MKYMHRILTGFTSICVLGLLAVGGHAAYPVGDERGFDCGCTLEAQEPSQKKLPLDVKGETSRVHDPGMTKERDTYFVFSTGRGITVHTSKDMVTWGRPERVFEKPIDWTAATVPGSTDYYWAPDISFFNGRWHLYYSISTFGKNRSAIGLATNTTLDPRRPGYHWKDEGIVVESKQADDWNAIDPNIALDEKGNPWLSFGSFWSGIKLVRIDASTGKRDERDSQLFSLASRPRGGDIKGAIEAPYIIRRGKFYYLFASFDICCRGAASTYNVRVGRAGKITGPYVDRDGQPMLEGGGKRLLWGRERWKGPGHNAVYREKSADWLVYHSYDAEDRGTPKLRIEKMTWTADGWPEAPSMVGSQPNPIKSGEGTRP